MGLFTFIKDAGAKLFGGDTTAESNDKKEQAIIDFVHKLGLNVQGLSVNVDGDKATILGTTETQADKEKVLLACGNVNGIATVDDQLRVVPPQPEVAPEPESRYYTVVRGDSLSKIAKEMYGNAMKYPVIFEANKPMLKNPDLIYPGQVLRIPALD